MFPLAGGIIVFFVTLAAIWPRWAQMVFNWLQAGIAQQFGWLYIFSMTAFLVLAVWLALSRFGKIPLGQAGEKPHFNRLTWFAMLFSAGMGIGMLFFGVAEPMLHFLFPPEGPGETVEAARRAMGLTLFHWCLHPWALYALVGLSLAYFSFRRGMPLSFRSVFYPLLGKRIYGPLGHGIDILAVCATLFGLATSLGLGAKQVNAGLHHVFGLPQGAGIQVAIIASITAMAVVSLISGLDVGIRRLSELNMALAGLLLLFLFVAGPSGFLLGSVLENTGAYLRTLPTHALWTGGAEDPAGTTWLSSWTVFYWGWWIAWSPFVGMFIARISRGRTIREFVSGVLLVPSGVAIIWMTGFGGTGLHQEIYQDVAEDPAAVRQAFDYAPRAYPVQVLDPVHDLPLARDGWMVASGARVRGDDEGGLVAADGTPVGFRMGVLVNRDDGSPFRAHGESSFQGRFQAREANLTLGGFLSQPVLNESRTRLKDTTSTAMFVMLEAYPLVWLTALIGTLCVVLFFVTSSDSASLVADIIASGGNPSPPTATRIFWGVLEGVLAAVLLLAGGLQALQTGAITIGLPFCILILFMCVSLILGLRKDPSMQAAAALAQEEGDS